MTRSNARLLSLLGAALLAACEGLAASERDVPACFALPSEEEGLAGESREHAAKGKTGQGTKYQGNTRQGNTHQGKQGQGRGDQGASDAGQDRDELLHSLNGVRLVAPDDTPISLVAGILRRAHEAIASGPVRAETRDGRVLPICLSPIAPPAHGDDAARYSIEYAGEPLCAAGELGLFVEGAWDASGAHEQDDGTLTFACDSGVIAKCVRWGYAPWRVGSALHQACTRMARADYCGTGASWTREGTLINVYDRRGIQRSQPSVALSFEAGWGPDGAVCVSHTRYQVTDALGATQQPPCWQALPRCDERSQEALAEVLIANDSAGTSIAACEQ